VFPESGGMDVKEEASGMDIEEDETMKSQVHWGQVRASPYGSCLTKRNAAKWHGWRDAHLDPLVFPLEGFGHVYGQPVIDAVDQNPLGANKVLGKAVLDKLGKPLSKVEEEKNVDGHDYGATKTPGMWH
jgi:hypothetical protein